MSECDATFDGEHHWAKRHWLARDESGASYDQTLIENWEWVWACVCKQRPPDELIPALETLARETRNIKALRFGVEQGDQERMPGL